MKTNKHRIKRLSAVILLMLMVTALLPVSVFAEELPTTSVTITLEKKASSYNPTGAEEFTYALTPDDAGFPMPDGEDGDTIIIHGSGTASFKPITYTEPRVYTYTIREIPGNAPNTVYDKTAYTVSVYVTADAEGKLTSKLLISKTGSDAKTPTAVFGETHDSDPNQPNTGDTIRLPLLIALVAGSAVVLVVLTVGYRRRKRDSQ